MICANPACRSEIRGGAWIIEQGQRLPGGRIARRDERYCSDACAQDHMTEQAKILTYSAFATD